MDEKLLEIREFIAPGYQPVIDYDKWRVAILNYLDEIKPENISYFERHNETDEVFVLIKGRGILFVGEGEDILENIFPQILEVGKIFNVKKGVWHSVILSTDGSVLIVENRNTGRENTDYITLDRGQRDIIISTANSKLMDSG
jgi:mannose-6-phosphate isomerase-like protein (cupin superfamily)